MAAHVDIDDFEYHTISLTTTGSARGIDGPNGARAFEFYVNTAGTTVYAQTGDQTDGTTDLSTNGAPAPVQAWNKVHATRVSAPMAENARRVTVFLQTDTNPTSITYRFVPESKR